MLIKRQGITRICNEADYKRKFKSLGFKIIKKEKSFDDLNEDEIRTLAEEKGINNYWNSKIETLIDKLKEVDNE